MRKKERAMGLGMRAMVLLQLQVSSQNIVGKNENLES